MNEKQLADGNTIVNEVRKKRSILNDIKKWLVVEKPEDITRCISMNLDCVSVKEARHFGKFHCLISFAHLRPMLMNLQKTLEKEIEELEKELEVL